MQRHKIKHPESVAIVNARKGRYGHRLNGLICNHQDRVRAWCKAQKVPSPEFCLPTIISREKNTARKPKEYVNDAEAKADKDKNGPMGGDIYDDSASISLKTIENIWNIFWEDLLEIILYIISRIWDLRYEK